MATGKPPLTHLSELTPGQRGDFFALLQDRTRGQTREGRPYFHCRFRDARRTVSLMVWSDDKWFEQAERDWQAGQFYKLRAVYGEHERYGPQIELLNLRPVTDTDRDAGFDPNEFFESTRYDVRALLAELRELATTHIADEPLRGLVLALLEKYEEPFLRLPASRDRAYPYRGGLIEHTVQVTRIAVDLAHRYRQAYPDLRPALNVDLVTAAAILHDFGRLGELGDEQPVPAYTVPGRLTGGTVLGRDLVRDAARERGDVNPELLQLLEHILLNPLYPPDGPGPRWPAIPEALLVQYADDLDVKMALYARTLLRDDGPGPFTDREPVLGRHLLKARGV
ncbi:MAG: HD domain-containing protein [Gemmataceae bacterium]